MLPANSFLDLLFKKKVIIKINFNEIFSSFNSGKQKETILNFPADFQAGGLFQSILRFKPLF
jgi:hypothetical protein